LNYEKAFAVAQNITNLFMKLYAKKIVRQIQPLNNKFAVIEIVKVVITKENVKSELRNLSKQRTIIKWFATTHV